MKCNCKGNLCYGHPVPAWVRKMYPDAVSVWYDKRLRLWNVCVATQTGQTDYTLLETMTF